MSIPGSDLKRLVFAYPASASVHYFPFIFTDSLYVFPNIFLVFSPLLGIRPVVVRVDQRPMDRSCRGFTFRII